MVEEYKRVSVADVRKHKGFEHLTDEQIERAITAFEKLAIYLYKKHLKEQKRKQEEEQVMLSKA